MPSYRLIPLIMTTSHSYLCVVRVLYIMCVCLVWGATVRIFAWYGHLRWGFRTPKWEHKSGARNYFPFEIEKTKRNKSCMLPTYNRIRSQKFRFRSGSSFAPHFCAPTGVSGFPLKWGILKWIPDSSVIYRLADWRLTDC